jgi:hypothetical protein
MNATVSEKVQYKDRNALNLKRDNLILTPGRAKYNAREKLLPENIPHSFLRNVQLKSTDVPVSWASELRDASRV